MANVQITVSKNAIPLTSVGMDSDFINLSQLGTLPELPTEIYRTVAPELGFLHFLSNLPDYTDKDMFVDEKFIRWGTQGDYDRSFLINGNYTGSLSNLFSIPVDTNAIGEGANILTQSRNYAFRVNAVIPNGQGSILQCQTIGPEIPAGELQAGQRLNYATNSFEEGSRAGHKMLAIQKNEYHMQLLQQIRTDLPMTGDAQTQAYRIKMHRPDVDKSYYGYIPDVITNTGTSLLSEHLTNINNALWWGLPNFNMDTGAIYNQNAQGAYVPQMAGLKYQIENAVGGYRAQFDPQDDPVNILNMLTRAMEYVSYTRNARDIKMYCVGGSGARALFRKANQLWIQRNTNITVQVDSKGGEMALKKTPIPTGVEILPTEWGEVHFMLMDTADGRLFAQTDLVAIDGGIGYPRSSFAMYLFPLITFDNGKQNIWVSCKGKDGHSRKLIAGVIPGMTGRSGSGNSIRTSFRGMKGMDLSGFAPVSTGQDADTFMLSSQMAPVLSTPRLSACLLPY